MACPGISVSSFIALAAAMAFGFSGATSKRGLACLEPLTGTLVTVVGTCLGLHLLTAPLWMRAGDWFTAGFRVFAFGRPARCRYVPGLHHARRGRSR